MNNIYRGALLITIALTGCAGSKLPTSQPANDVSQAQIDAVQKKMVSCISEVNSTEDAKYVDAHIIALIPNSPNAKELFNSSNKISSDQAVVLKRYEEVALKCRAIANELPTPALVGVYTNFYEKIDAVYADLISKRITIGVANQERAMRIQYARSRWAEIVKAQKGG